MSSEYKDHYATLGVQASADAKAILTAYRKLAKVYHPDLHQHDSEAEKEWRVQKFKEINDANEVLSDPDKRRTYDLWYFRYGRTAFTGTPTPEPPRQETNGQQQPPRTESPPPPKSEPKENQGSVFKSVDELLAFAGLSQRYQELLQFNSINRIAAEETLPLLNVIFQAASLWLAKDSQANPGKKETNTAIRNSMARFLERLTESEYLLGKPITVVYPDSETARLIAGCCSHIQKKNCSVLYTRNPGVITISLSAHRLADTYEKHHQNSKIPPWENSRSTYQWLLKESTTSIYSILHTKESLIAQTWFLRESGSGNEGKPGLVDVYSVWLSKNNLSELTFHNDYFVMKTIDACQAYFTQTPDLTLEQMVIFITSQFKVLTDSIDAPNLELIKQVLIQTFQMEYGTYSVITDPRESLTGVQVALNILFIRGYPLRPVASFIQESDKQKNNQLAYATDWKSVQSVFSELQYLNKAITKRPLLFYLEAAHKLPRFLQLRELYLFHYLRETQQLEKYVNYVLNPPLVHITKEHHKWSGFERSLNQLGWRDEFRQFCLDRS